MVQDPKITLALRSQSTRQLWGPQSLICTPGGRLLGGAPQLQTPQDGGPDLSSGLNHIVEAAPHPLLQPQGPAVIWPWSHHLQAAVGGKLL